MTVGALGFIGLGNMGGALAANLVHYGLDVIAYDTAGPELRPDGARFAESVTEVAQHAATIVLSLPDGSASTQVVRDILAAPRRHTTHVVDTSTIGVAAAEANAALLAEAGLAAVDAPVSGGVAGARARTLLVMYAGTDDACAYVRPVVEGLSDRHCRVGDRPGAAQAMKLLNNFLAATTLAATSEAIAFGLTAGLNMATMLEVLNAASGQSAATSEKFPQQILTGRYAAGFSNTLMSKDLQLYLQEVGTRDVPDYVGALIASVWERFAAAEPGADFTRVFPFVTAPAKPHDHPSDARQAPQAGRG